MRCCCCVPLDCIASAKCFVPSAGVEPMQVQETVENHLKSLLIKHFDPRKADSIFTEEGEVCMESLLLCILPRCLYLMEWWREGKLNLQSSLAEEQLVLEKRQRFRELGNLECSFVIKLCRTTHRSAER